MSSVPSTSNSSASSASAANAAAVNAAFASLGPADFLKMMLAQLQNQDPLDPTNTDDMLSQLSTLSQVSSNQTLDTTLSAVQLGQNLSDAGALIGTTVSGLSDASTQITGNVDSVTITGGTPTLNIGSNTMSLSNIEAIYPPGSAATGSSTTDGSTGDGSTGDGSTGDGSTDGTGGTST
jgi:flagellar basal-body rod modification protein FlgD